MGGVRSGSAGAVLATFAAAGAVLAGALPAYADGTVTVQGTAFPDPVRANLSFVGCGDLYQRSDERLAPMVGYGPGAAPSGTRSLGWDLAGGNAVGVLYSVGSVLSTSTASMAVNSEGPATGVAYAGYQEPADDGTTLLWIGRAELTTPGGAWQTVDATTRSYLWTKYDMSTGAPVADGPGVATTVAGFAAAHGGDGPGVFTIGFGCDGTPFSMDVLRVGTPLGTTTYDLEGLQTHVGIATHRTDDGVEVTGSLHTATGDPVPHATLILEQRTAGSRWEQVLVAGVGSDGTARASVQPEERTFYRWRFVDRPLAVGSLSMQTVVNADPTDPTDPPHPTESPSTDPSLTASPSAQPSDRPSDQPSLDPSPSDDPTSDSPTPSATHSEATESPEATAGPGSESSSPSASETGSAGPTEPLLVSAFASAP